MLSLFKAIFIFLRQKRGILEFPKIRHCEALKKEGAISRNSSFRILEFHI
ncbi:MAG: hypothetical protein MR469_02250 [Campylobacter sp.]|nr:hypothetical protein [Campylobacter sp.]MCI6694446.1 hypothetical protein [Campylobacter sp.]MCI6818501.1 hypothetical protein [Campylobacter sp.]